MPLVRSLRQLKLSRVDLVPKGSNPGAHIALYKNAPEDSSVETPSDDTPDPTAGAETSQEETQMSQTDTTATETEAAETPVTEVETPEAAETVETPQAAPVAEAEVEKSEPETITKAEAEAIRKENADLNAKVAKMEADARKAEFVAKARADYGALGDPEKVGILLMKAEDGTPFDATEKAQFDALLKGAVAQAETGALFSQFAKTGESETATWWDRLAKKASELVEKGEAETIEQAKAAVMKADPELRKEYAMSVRS